MFKGNASKLYIFQMRFLMLVAFVLKPPRNPCQYICLFIGSGQPFHVLTVVMIYKSFFPPSCVSTATWGTPSCGWRGGRCPLLQGRLSLDTRAWHLVLGTWHLACGKCNVAVLGICHLSFGSWHLALGTGHWTLGTWHLTFDTWHLTVTIGIGCFAFLNS